MAATATTRRPGGRPNLELLRARINKGYSRAELAHLAGLSTKQIGLIERGKAIHSREATLHAIASVLGEEVVALFPVERRFR